MPIDPVLMKQLIDTFKTELEELLQVITSGLLTLEKNNLSEQAHADTIASIFRAGHNIKGSSLSLGIQNVGGIAHGIESLFSGIQKKIVPMSPAIIDLCLEAVDNMRIAMQAFLAQHEPDFNVKEFIVRLNTASSSQVDVASPQPSNLDEQKDEQKDEKKDEQKDEKKDEVSIINTTKHAEKLPIIKSSDMIRVSIDDIEHLSSLMEELQVSKIAIDDHFIEITKLTSKINQFYEIWKQLAQIMQNPVNTKIPDFLQRPYYAGNDLLIEVNQAMNNLQKNMKMNLSELNIHSNSIQQEIRILRLVPASTLLCTMPRIVRDLSRDLNKMVDLIITGDEIKMDKLVLEGLKNPIIHILRNCIDHGIESVEERKENSKPEAGLITIDISEENNQTLICISDNGRGIDVKRIAAIAEKNNLFSKDDLAKMNENEILDLIFYSGFTTKDKVTSVSGRGVGLDVVKDSITSLNGTVNIKNNVGKGTAFELRVPLTLASERGLLITCAGQHYVLPISSIHRVLSIRSDDVIEVAGAQAILLEKQSITLHTLSTILGLEQNQYIENRQLHVVILKNKKNIIALLVDEIFSEREIVIKPLQKILSAVACVYGGTLLGGNQVIIVLDPNYLIESVVSLNKIHKILFHSNVVKSVDTPQILIADDSITTRTLEKNILESKNYKVTVAVNGKEALDLLKKQKFSLLITDVNMPIMDGFTLTAEVKKNETFKEMPVIIVTSLGSDEEKRRGIEVGADAYIVKNEFESGTLLDIVEQLI